jgi:hypothetical protein
VTVLPGSQDFARLIDRDAMTFYFLHGSLLEPESAKDDAIGSSIILRLVEVFCVFFDLTQIAVDIHLTPSNLIPCR